MSRYNNLDISSRSKTIHEVELGYSSLTDIFERGGIVLELEDGSKLELSANGSAAEGVFYLSDAYNKEKLYEICSNSSDCNEQ